MSAIMICNVPVNLTTDLIRGLFSGCGDVLEAHREMAVGTFSVTFVSDGAARVATQCFNGIRIPGQNRLLSIYEVPKPTMLQMESLFFNTVVGLQGDDKKSNLFVYGISSKVADCEIYSKFASFGPLRSIRLEVHLSTGKRKNYGYVSYCYMLDAKIAQSSLNGYVFHGRQLDVSFYTPRKP
eukprot:TRINITY_DN14209_c0_g1_i1.p1 TRINITY_DN14209_c0_g1~~TRINITY_DN14209_c0_g1_i1.p1  ORF type:complete len:182 (+),score=27.64 TRINITY_DN14209_c0_g1_i1:58-603(+)